MLKYWWIWAQLHLCAMLCATGGLCISSHCTVPFSTSRCCLCLADGTCSLLVTARRGDSSSSNLMMVDMLTSYSLCCSTSAPSDATSRRRRRPNPSCPLAHSTWKHTSHYTHFLLIWPSTQCISITLIQTLVICNIQLNSNSFWGSLMKVNGMEWNCEITS